MWSDVWSGLVGDGDGDFHRAFDVDGVRQLDTGGDSIVEEGQAVDYQQLIQQHPTDVADAHVEGAGVCHSQLQGEHILAALHQAELHLALVGIVADGHVGSHCVVQVLVGGGALALQVQPGHQLEGVA